MGVEVVVYAAHPVRGQIIARTLTACGIKTTYYHNVEPAVAQLESGAAALLVADVNNHLAHCLAVVRALATHHGGTLLVTHTDPRDQSRLIALGLEAEDCLGGPLEPERIFAAVQERLAHPLPAPKHPGPRPATVRTQRQRRRQFIRAVFQGKPLRPPLWSPVLRAMARTASVALLMLFGVMAGVVYWSLTDLPDLSRLENFSPFKTTQVFTDDNRLLAELYAQRRHPVPLGQVPAHVQRAFIAVEDTRYFKHSGIDLIRIAGALWADIKSGGYHQGGSTITQQLSKMLFLKPEKTIARKIKEMAIAVRLEQLYAKDKILALYLNQAYFGAQAYGIQAAAAAYFGKDVAELSLAEGALLAALPKAPAVYSPFHDRPRSLQRRNLVLRRMLDNGFVTREAFEQALTEDLPGVFHGRPYHSAYFVDYCREILEADYGDRLQVGGLKVYTTLDSRLQAAAEAAVQQGLAAMAARGVTGVEAALVALELDSGRIKAMVGGSDYRRSQFNRATQALRQPGSAFKPIVYLAALQKGYRPDSLVADVPVVLGGENGGPAWQPRNYDGRFHGTLTLEEALTRSLNAATVNLALKVGLTDIIGTARQLGIQSPIQPYYPSVLGASELTLIELVAAYGTLATGRRLVPLGLDRVIDHDRMSIWAPGEGASGEAVLPPRQVEAMRGLLAAVVARGTARPALSLNRPVYGKTGTTNSNADALFVGFDAQRVVGVWVGRDNREPIGPKETGSRAALPIWIAFMQAAAPDGVKVAATADYGGWD